MDDIKTITRPIVKFFYEKGIKILYKKGEHFFRPEDSVQGIYYLESGTALLYSPKANGLEQIIAIGEEGNIFGKVGSVMRQPQAHIFAQANTDCIVYRIACGDFLKLIETEKSACEAYMQQVARNNVYLLAQIQILGEKDILTKVMGELLFLALHHGDMEGASCKLRVTLTQEQMANMMCVSREYYNKTLKIVKKKEMIDIKKGRIVIPNLSALQKEYDNRLGRMQ